MSGAAPVTFEENPSFGAGQTMMKGSPVTRKSRRAQGMEPEELVSPGKVGQEVMNLIRKGGVAGRYVEESSKWDYFPVLDKHIQSPEQRKQHNTDIFHTLQTCYEPDILHEDEYKNDNQCTHQILHIAKLQKLINEQCISKYCFEQRMDDFLIVPNVIFICHMKSFKN